MHNLALEFRILFWAILGVIVPFGLLLYFLPGETGAYWAWNISHPRSSILIGAGYVGAIVYYVRALRENDWLQVQNGMGGLIIFCVVLLVATLLHWETFKPYHITTLVWLIFYYVGPFLVPIFYRLQGSRAKAVSIEGTRIASAWRWWMVVRGLFYLILALFGLVFASVVRSAWPWPIEPLELRVFMGQVAIIGWNAAIALRDGLPWRRHRLGLVLTGAIGLIQIAGLFISSTPYDLSAPMGIILLLIFVEWLTTPVLMQSIYRKK